MLKYDNDNDDNSVGTAEIMKYYSVLLYLFFKQFHTYKNENLQQIIFLGTK